MAIIINGKKYKDVPKNIAEILNTLKEPTVIPLGQCNIETQKTLICLQHEGGYYDMLNPTLDLTHIGSKYAFECIVVYLYSETDHFIIHVDVNQSIKLKQSLLSAISSFNYTNEIKVILAGGYSCENSRAILNKIINALFALTKEKPEINIIFEAQKILERNQSTEESQREFIFDYLSEQAKIFSEKILKKPLPQVILSKKISNFEEELPQEISEKELVKMAIGIVSVKYFYDKDNNTHMDYSNQIKKIAQEKLNFIKLIGCMFSKKGYSILLQTLPKSQTRLKNFVFDITTKNIIVIPKSFETPNEIERKFVLSIGCYKDENTKNEYFLCYNGRQNGYIFPDIDYSVFSKEKKIRLMKLLKNERISKKDVEKLFYGTDSAGANSFNVICEFGKKISDNPIPVNSPTFFHETTKIIYKLNNKISNQNITILNTLTKQKFIPQMRYFPEYIVDATLKCDFEEAENLQKFLQEKNIVSKVIKCSEPNNYLLCVVAINVNQYGRSIEQAYNSARIFC